MMAAAYSFRTATEQAERWIPGLLLGHGRPAAARPTIGSGTSAPRRDVELVAVSHLKSSERWPRPASPRKAVRSSD